MNDWQQIRAAIKRLFRATTKLRMPCVVRMWDEHASYQYTFGPKEWRKLERQITKRKRGKRKATRA